MAKNQSRKDRLQTLFLLWKTEDCPRAKNRIFKEVERSFKPYILNRIKGDDKYDQEEVLSLYQLEVLRCLDTYIGRNDATAMTYLYFSIKRIVYEYFIRNKPLVSGANSADIESLNEVGQSDL